jgi:hypothetical protein
VKSKKDKEMKEKQREREKEKDWITLRGRPLKIDPFSSRALGTDCLSANSIYAYLRERERERERERDKYEDMCVRNERSTNRKEKTFGLFRIWELRESNE